MKQHIKLNGEDIYFWNWLFDSKWWYFVGVLPITTWGLIGLSFLHADNEEVISPFITIPIYLALHYFIVKVMIINAWKFLIKIED